MQGEAHSKRRPCRAHHIYCKQVRTLQAGETYPFDSEEGLAPALLFDDQSVLYTPAREHESPAHQRRRTKRFRMREEQVLSKFAQHFRRLSESASDED